MPKAAARRLAEAGCTMHEIAAITGHVSLSEFKDIRKRATISGSHCRLWKRPNSEHQLSNFLACLTIRLNKHRKIKTWLKGWWAREDSNLQPDRYERSALTS